MTGARSVLPVLGFFFSGFLGISGRIEGELRFLILVIVIVVFVSLRLFDIFLSVLRAACAPSRQPKYFLFRDFSRNTKHTAPALN